MCVVPAQVYDICERESFNHVDDWLTEVNRCSTVILAAAVDLWTLVMKF